MIIFFSGLESIVLDIEGFRLVFELNYGYKEVVAVYWGRGVIKR